MVTSYYKSKISSYTKKELEEEEHKLSNLLNSVTEEYLDREDTIHLILAQLHLVRDTKVYKYEEPSI